MASVAPSAAQIRAQVAALREKHPDARAIGIRSPVRWEGPETLLVEGRTLPVRSCESTLEIREALLASEAQGAPVVIVTPLEDTDLEADLRARFARGRLLTIHSWDILREALKLRDIDSRLTSEPWMADVLLEGRGTGSAPVVPSGFLDADTAWDIVASSLGLPTGRPDALELLRWIQLDGVSAYRAASGPVREGLRRRVRDTAGVAGEVLVDCLAAGAGEDVVALGVVCGVVFHPSAPPEARIPLERAAVRLERYCGNRPVPAAAGRAWALAAETVLEDLIQGQDISVQARTLLQRADALLNEVEAHEHAHLARYSLLGFEQRLAHCAVALSEALVSPAPTTPSGMSSAVAALREHGLARAQRERVNRIEMAVRLVRWLGAAGAAPVPSSFENAVVAYTRDTALADTVRAALEAGDGCEPLSSAYSRLLARVGELRERDNERFGRLLTDWVAANGSLRDALRIEDVLSKVVAPIAEKEPVLLLVVDGLSVAVYSELVQDLAREGWIELVPSGSTQSRAVVAALPTVTEVSRASLLCGRLCNGVSRDEKAGFEAHPELLKHTGRKKPPILFHKAELGDAAETGLASGVRAELADPDRRVVGIVINAIDDHLAKGDQIRPRWGIESIRPLRGTLHAAQQAGRIVVMTSDHGHVPERGSELRSYPEGERWRSDDGTTSPAEVVLSGPRVVLPVQHRLIAPWSERVRYGIRKNGYHGGASPQEVVVPLGVFTPGIELAGWDEIPPAFPAWWTDEAPLPAAPRRVLTKKRTRAPEGQGALFQPPPRAAAPLAAEWIEDLLKSATWKIQAQAAGRMGLEPARVRLTLQALEQRGGRLTRTALAQRIGLPTVRVTGFVAALRRVLNVDGYAVLDVDEPSESLTLNLDLLRKQFELP